MNSAFEKLDKLKDLLKSLAPLAVAFSGGVDSTFLLRVASDTLGKEACAITVNSPYIANWEIEEADELTEQLGVAHAHILAGIPEIIKYNPEDRCFLCKTAVFTAIKKEAAAKGFYEVVDGSNADDLNDYRPGMKALKNLGIRSPLLEVGMTKTEIRFLSKELGLSTWDKPPYACLLTRLPYDTEVDELSLRMIEHSEKFIMDRGIKGIRVRKHDKIARIEISKEEMSKILDLRLMEEIDAYLKDLGFDYVTLDLSGYKMGNFNRDLNLLKGSNDLN